MTYSTGIDLVEIDRIRKGYNRYREKFLERIFSDGEIAILRSRKRGMVASMAGKFAAKEAVMKALITFFSAGVFLRDIEILNDANGSPYVKLAQHLAAKIPGKKIHLSISHERIFACAVVVITD